MNKNKSIDVRICLHRNKLSAGYIVSEKIHQIKRGYRS
jgi:hypothetical protein